MAFGACLSILYLEWRYPSIGHALSDIKLGLLFSGNCLVFTGNALTITPRQRRQGSDVQARWSGAFTILMTGAVATYFLWHADGSTHLGAVVIAVVTILATAYAWLFATKHADEIGEARFVTDTTGAAR